MEPLFPLGVLAPMLGAASAILEGVVQSLDRRPVPGWTYANQGQSHTLVAMVGQSAMEIESAWLHVRRAVAILHETAHTPVPTGFGKAQIQADCVHAVGR